MPNKHTFEYAIVRLVPRVEREEFFNIGVILFSKRLKYLGVKFHVDAKKLASFTEEIEVAEVEKYLQSWDCICAGKSSGGTIATFEMSDRFRWLAASRSTIIQSSKTHPGLTENAEKALEDIFKKYVK